MIRLALVLALAVAPAAASARSLVSTMNAKLHRYVHPTGKCAGGSEKLATMYGNGDGEVGKPVACGGVLNTHRATVAHRSLPCGTTLHLTNPHNGRSVTAVVTDRGPYTIASLDLGPATYRALGINTSTYVCVSGM